MIASRLKELRTSRRISQQKLANQLGVAQQTVAGWEVNRTEPSQDFLKRIAAYFGVPVSYFFDEDETRPAENYPPALSADELDLLNSYRDLDNHGRQAIWSLFNAIKYYSAQSAISKS